MASWHGRDESVEIIILDNGSTDGTKEWLSTLSHPNVHVVFNDGNLGKGGSIKRGIALSKGEYVVIHDPDMEYEANDIWTLLQAARSDGAQMVLGSRILGGKDISYRYFANYIGVQFLTFVINRLFAGKLTDPATAMKLLDGELARRIKLQSNGFDLDFEIVVRVLRLGHTVAERRIKYSPRSKAQGKKLRAWRDGLLAMRAILRDRLLSRGNFTDCRSA